MKHRPRIFLGFIVVQPSTKSGLLYRGPIDQYARDAIQHAVRFFGDPGLNWDKARKRYGLELRRVYAIKQPETIYS